MSENTTKAACTQAEFDMARTAGLFVATVADERAIHAFAESIRREHRSLTAAVNDGREPAALIDDEWRDDYHCAVDCGQPHNQKERAAYVQHALTTFDALTAGKRREMADAAQAVRRRAKDAI